MPGLDDMVAERRESEGSETDVREAQKSEKMLNAYQVLLQYTQNMLAHAREGNWTALLDFEARYIVQVETLARLEQDVVLSGEEADHKADLLAAILRNGQMVREYLVARRNELGELMQTQRNRRDLNRSYGATVSPLDPLRGDDGS